MNALLKSSHKMNLKFTDALLQALQSAMQIAEESLHTEVTENHILFSLLSDEQGYFVQFAKSVGLDPASLRKSLEQALTHCPQFTKKSQKPNISIHLQKKIAEAEKLAKSWKDDFEAVCKPPGLVSNSNIEDCTE